MNPFDIIIIVIFTYFLIMGFFRGMIREISAIAGVLGGFFTALFTYKYLADYLSGWVSDPSYQKILSFLIIFSVVFMTVGIIGLIIKYLLKIADLRWTDRLLGGVFAGLKAVLVASVLLVVFTTFLTRDAPFLRQSVLAPYVMVVSEQMARMVSKDMKKEYQSKLKSLKDAWSGRHPNTGSDTGPEVGPVTSPVPAPNTSPQSVRKLEHAPEKNA